MSFGGLDIGTSGCKCTLFDESGKQLAAAYRGYEVTRITGRHEIDIKSIWEGVKVVIARAVKESPGPLEAICISSFGESCALLDDTERPVIPAMLYTDPRGSEEAALLSQTSGDYHIYEVSGHRPDATYTLPKLMWLRKYQPDCLEQVVKILPIASCITYFLTGETVCDPSLAARTMMLDINKLDWSEELLSKASISADMMPEVAEIGAIAGTIKKSVAEELGIPADVKIVIGGHDQVMAAIGAGVTGTGSAVNSSGTVECVTPVFDKVRNPEYLFAGHYSLIPTLNGQYATYATVFSGGVLLRWFIDNFTGVSKDHSEKQWTGMFDYLDSEGQEGPTGILVLPHFTGSASPYYDPNSKGAVTGLTLEHTAADIYRALQEGICYEIALNLELLSGAGIPVTGLKIVGGGERSLRWNQMKADMYGIPCTTLKAGEAGAAGSAMLAGIALGKYHTLEQAIAALVAENETFLPRREYTERYRPYFERYKRLYNAVKDI
ncbi:MAG: hypothetical protein JW712_01095 [Dehalococcoidales bacterium]|nr:hypothetical protein [Dehalococcoidales bacterium]